jgi:hypothetical protein
VDVVVEICDKFLGLPRSEFAACLAQALGRNTTGGRCSELDAVVEESCGGPGVAEA